jgi:serine/threonine-protein kinase
VRLAREIADALAHAHARGIVHRDVKPENVLLQAGERPHALVADFGVALAVEHAGGTRLTRTGLSIGTPQYMAPEQARGERGVDARADVYALGAVLYEMLAGAPPFAAASPRLVLTRALTEPAPPLAAERPDVPPHVAAAVATALAKQPDARWATVGAFADAIAGVPALAAAAAPRPAAPPAPRPRRPSPVLAAVAGALVVGGALGWRAARAVGAPAAAPDAPAAAAPSGGGNPSSYAFAAEPGTLGADAPAVSPDGRTTVFRYAGPGGPRLYARRVDDLVPRALEGTEDAEQPFFSPDGASVGFVSRGALRRVPVDGGEGSVVAALPDGFAAGGASWGADGSILAADRRTGALYRVPAAGGALARVALADPRQGVRDPHPLPGGQRAVVTLADCCEDRMGVLDLATGAVREIGRGLAPRLVGGALVYATRDGALYRQPFDGQRGETRGAAEPLGTAAGGAVAVVDGRPAFDVADAGTLVYRTAAPANAGRPDRDALRLTVRDRAGRALLQPAARIPWTPRVSPDGRTVAYGAFAPGGEASELWAADLRTGATRQLTADGADANDPQWSPDGRTLAYSASVGGKQVFVRALAGGPRLALAHAGGNTFPTDWLPDGRAVLATADQNGSRDVVVLPADGGPARAYAATPANESAARVSPDGRWIAYQSDADGRDAVYVDGYPTPGRRTRVSAAGGVHPVWSRDGRTLFYWDGDRLVAAQLAAGAAGGALAVAGRAPLFRGRYPDALFAMYDVTPDGRFVMAAGPDTPDRLVVVPDAVGRRR